MRQKAFVSGLHSKATTSVEVSGGKGKGVAIGYGTHKSLKDVVMDLSLESVSSGMVMPRKYEYYTRILVEKR